MKKEEEIVVEKVIKDLQLLLNKKEEKVEDLFQDWLEETEERGEKIYPLQIKYAKKLVEKIEKNPSHLRYNVVLPMQGGKSALIGAAAKLLLLKELEYTLVYMCALPDKLVWNDVFSYYSEMGLTSSNPRIDIQIRRSDLIAAKPSELWKERLDTSKKYIVFWDECHYGDGEEQKAAQSFINYLRRSDESIIVGISATSFAPQIEGKNFRELGENAKMNSTDAVIISPSLEEMEQSGYHGPSSLLRNNQVIDCGIHIKLRDGLNSHFEDAIHAWKEDYDKSNKKRRIALLRLPPAGESNRNTQQVKKDVEDLIRNTFPGIKVNFEKVGKDTRYEIPFKNSITVYHTQNSLRAGKRMDTAKGKSLKPYIAMVWESSDSHVASTTQGLPGRICGYVNNKHIRVYCDMASIEFYSEYEHATYDINNIPDHVFARLGRVKGDGRTNIKMDTVRRISADVELMSEQEYDRIKNTLGRHMTKTSSGGASEAHTRKMLKLWNEFQEKEENGKAYFEQGFEFFTRRKTDEETGEKEDYSGDFEYGAVIFDEKCKDVDKIRKIKENVNKGGGGLGDHLWPSNFKFKQVLLMKKKSVVEQKPTGSNSESIFNKPNINNRI